MLNWRGTIGSLVLIENLAEKNDLNFFKLLSPTLFREGADICEVQLAGNKLLQETIF